MKTPNLCFPKVHNLLITWNFEILHLRKTKIWILTAFEATIEKKSLQPPSHIDKKGRLLVKYSSSDP